MRLFKLMADAQEQILRSPYPDLLLEMTVVRMATLAPVMDADELLRALGASGGAPAPRPAPPPPVPGRGRALPRASPTRNPLHPQAHAACGSRARSRPTRRCAPPVPGLDLTAAGGDPPAPASAMSAPSRLVPLTAAQAATAPADSAASDLPSLPDLPELREHIRARRAALAGFMEQGASLSLDGDLLRVIPRNDIYIRYLNDNRASIGELASELYGRKLRVEVSLKVRRGRLRAAATSAVTSRYARGAPPPRFCGRGRRIEYGATQSVAPSTTAEQASMPAPAVAAP